jgi:nicotinamide-nucleotide adenylyltransferase
VLARALFVGRFQPFHFGHLHAIQTILEEAEELIIVVGSAQMSHEPDNPFTAGERIEMIRAALKEAGVKRERYMLIPIADAPSHRTWVSYVESQTPRFDVVYSNQALTSRLLIEAGYIVKEIPLHKRRIVEEIDGENRIRDLSKSDTIRVREDNQSG